MKNNSSLLSARRIGLHPWRMIVERYAGERPAKLKGSIVVADINLRYEWMKGVVSLNHGSGDGLIVHDYMGRTINVGSRVVEHIRSRPERAPYLTWVTTALQSPLEVWRSHRFAKSGLEAHLYYMYATSSPSIHNVVVIVSEHDSVAFNVIPFAAREAKLFRIGEICFVGYDQPFGRCPHGCCERTELA